MSKSGRIRKSREKTGLPIHLFFILFAVVCIAPMMLVISASLTSVPNLSKYGFRLLPVEVDTSSYAYLFTNPKMIIDGYGVTIFITVVGTFLSVLFMSMMAYALARPQFKLRNGMAFFVFLPTLFSGGLVSSYLINSQYLHLTDSVWAMILPGLVNAFHIFMIRTFFKELPTSLLKRRRWMEPMNGGFTLLLPYRFQNRYWLRWLLWECLPDGMNGTMQCFIYAARKIPFAVFAATNDDESSGAVE